MVRLLLVRHAQSQMNVYQEDMSTKLTRGELTSAKFIKALRDGPPGTAAGDDAVLSELGQTQARRLGEVWGHSLIEKARAGKLIVFVSPFTRTLQTADPLMREIIGQCPGFQALVLPAIMEAGGLMHAEDLRRFDSVDELTRQGRRKEALELFKSFIWQPQGLTARQMRSHFPWARTQPTAEDKALLHGLLQAGVPDGDLREDDPWWTGGYESTKRAARRVDGVANWILSSVRNDTSEDTVVLMVSHGAMIEQTANSLLHYSFTGRPVENPSLSLAGVRNSSVTSLLLPSDRYEYLRERPNFNGEVVKFRCRLELFNDTAHLGDEMLRTFAIANLNAKL